jgi:CubicO group peptidase (beta-lactamase class C family)
LGVQIKIRKSSIPNGVYGWNGVYNTLYWVDPTNHLIGISVSQFVPNLSYLFTEFMSSDLQSA